MKAKRIVALVSLVAILAAGIFAVITASSFERTYDGNEDVVALYENPSNYTIDDVNSVADAIVKQNLEKTMAANNVAAVVFDFRGFDTLGESFILLTAIAGSFVILSIAKKKKEDDE